MKTLSITGPDAVVDQAVEAICGLHGFTGEPAECVAFACNQVLILLGDQMRAYAEQQIRQQALATVAPAVEAAHAAIAAYRSSIEVTIE